MRLPFYVCGPAKSGLANNRTIKDMRVILQITLEDGKPSYSGPHPFLANALMEWRQRKARSKNLPVFFILNQRVLNAIADAVPQTEEELRRIDGVGPHIFKRYGEDILRITTGRLT